VKESNEYKISAIIPFYNEEKTVSSVVGTVIGSGLFDEIVLVNDGSTDKSVKSVSEYTDDVVLVDYKNNKGKGHAISRGVKRAKGDIVCFIDADLTKLNNKHLHSLLDPLIKGNYDGTLGYMWDGLADIFFKPYGGQRAYFKKDLVGHLDDISKTNYGLEPLLNHIYRNRKIKEVPFKNAGHVVKPKKRNEAEFVNETIIWVTDVAKQLWKLKIINTQEYRAIIEIKNMRSAADLKDFVKKVKSKNLRKYVFSYVDRFLRYVKITN
jgi:glycosyltransferase involved in cell wall biosynthesis